MIMNFINKEESYLSKYPSKYFCLPRKKLAHFDFLGRHNLNQTLNAATMLL
jgi:hypothetical protein